MHRDRVGDEKVRDDGSLASMLNVHRTEIARQGAEWAQLRLANPRVPLVVAGDFNQSRDGSRWYGNTDTRARLSAALSTADLRCVTEEDVVATGKLKAHHLVDHICLTADLARDAIVSCWENVDADGQRLSDHPVVVAEL